MSLWYRTGGTLNFAWHVTSPGDPALAEKLYTAGYATIEADRKPTEYAPAGCRPGKYSDVFRRSAKTTEMDRRV